jgi:cell division protein FtsW
VEVFPQNIILFSRYLLPLLAAWLLVRCGRSMLRERYEPEIWAYIRLPDGTAVPVRHWECIIGRSRLSDIVVAYPTVSRSHAALIRNGKGVWTVYDLGSKGGIQVNGESVDAAELKDGDRLTLAGVHLDFMDLNEEERLSLSRQRREPGRLIRPGISFFILTIFQLLLALQHGVFSEPEHTQGILLAFLALSIAMWCYYLIMRSIRRTGFEAETIAFLLSTLRLSVAASSVPENMTKQVILLLAGIGLFIALGSDGLRALPPSPCWL